MVLTSISCLIYYIIFLAPSSKTFFPFLPTLALVYKCMSSWKFSFGTVNTCGELLLDEFSPIVFAVDILPIFHAAPAAVGGAKNDVIFLSGEQLG